MRGLKSNHGSLVVALSVTLTLSLTGCTSSGSSNPPPASSAATNQPVTSASSSATPVLEDDQPLDPGTRYPAPADFQPAFTFQAPSSHWYPYLRGGSAMNLREAKSADEDTPTSIEIVGDNGSLPEIVHALLSSSALRAGSQHRIKIGGRPGLWFDVTIRRSATLHAPASLDGEQLDPGQGLRVYAASGADASVLFLVLAARTHLAEFLPHARRLIASVRL